MHWVGDWQATYNLEVKLEQAQLPPIPLPPLHHGLPIIRLHRLRHRDDLSRKCGGFQLDGRLYDRLRLNRLIHFPPPLPNPRRHRPLGPRRLPRYPLRSRLDRHRSPQRLDPLGQLRHRRPAFRCPLRQPPLRRVEWVGQPAGIHSSRILSLRRPWHLRRCAAGIVTVVVLAARPPVSQHTNSLSRNSEPVRLAMATRSRWDPARTVDSTTAGR